MQIACVLVFCGLDVIGSLFHLRSTDKLLFTPPPPRSRRDDKRFFDLVCSPYNVNVLISTCPVFITKWRSRITVVWWQWPLIQICYTNLKYWHLSSLFRFSTSTSTHSNYPLKHAKLLKRSYHITLKKLFC